MKTTDASQPEERLVQVYIMIQVGAGGAVIKTAHQTSISISMSIFFFLTMGSQVVALGFPSVHKALIGGVLVINPLWCFQSSGRHCQFSFNSGLAIRRLVGHKALPVPVPFEDVWHLLDRYTLCLREQEEDKERPSNTEQAEEKEYAPLHNTTALSGVMYCIMQSCAEVLLSQVTSSRCNALPTHRLCNNHCNETQGWESFLDMNSITYISTTYIPLHV